MARPKRRRWGSGEVKQTASGKFRIRFWEGGRQRARGGFATREDAERVLAKIRGDIALCRNGLPPDPRGLPTLAELVPGILKRRELTHRSADTDRYRWTNHMEKYFGPMKPTAVDIARIRAFIEIKLADECNPASIRIMVALLSAVFVDLVERGLVASNPARGLPDSVRRMMRPTHDPRTTPFVEQIEDVRRIYLALREPLNVAYAIGAFGGLRTGEVFALQWHNVDLAARRIHVRESIKGPLKDNDSRMVPIQQALLPLLKAWKLKGGGAGRVIPSMRCDGEKIDKGTPGHHLQAVLEKLQLDRPGLGWYEATRHTFASQWVLAGGSIEKLKEILGHYSVVMTERYAHLRTDLFSDADLSRLAIDLRPGRAMVRKIVAKMCTASKNRAPSSEKKKKMVRAAL